jgi:hypothetical protein
MQVRLLSVITQAGLYCAASALAAAVYVHAMLRLARVVKRKFHFATVNAAMLPFVALMVVLIYLELLAVHDCAPDFEEAIGSATFLGLAVGRFVPVPGSSSRLGFSDDDISDDGGFDGDGDGGSGD